MTVALLSPWALRAFILVLLIRLLKATAVLRRAHGDPFRLINYIPYLKRNFNYSLR